MKSINFKSTVYLKIMLVCSLVLCFATACKKEWLDAKSDQTLAVPNTLKDLQAILDLSTVINGEGNNGKIMLSEVGELCSDNIFVTAFGTSADAKWLANAYSFSQDIYEGVAATNIPEMWNRPYQRIYYASVVLDELNKIKFSSAEQELYNDIKGTALFTRAYIFSLLLELYSKPYDPNTAANDLGIPLRLNSDLNTVSSRANVKTCFDRIIADLKEAASLLPNTTIYKTRPSKATANALLARVYLAMGDFSNTQYHAEESLKSDSKLIAYSSLSLTSTAPFPRYNEEVLYQDVRAGSLVLSASRGRIDPVLFNSYGANDLRKSLFFRVQTDGYYSFKGSYDGSASLFYGIAKDEVYLTLAECYARRDRVTDAMKYLNDLLRTRWDKNPDGTTKYIDATAANPADALAKVLTERRKELVFRGVRWMDLRRLNKEPAFQTTVKHTLSGTTYELPPGSPKYVFPIPDDIIQITGMPQNLR